jgi:hypothetical protein
VTSYIAKENIPVGGVLAYTRGQRVEADAVKANGWEDLVVAEGTKDARQIHQELGHPVDDAEPKSTSSEASKSSRASAKNEQEG